MSHEWTNDFLSDDAAFGEDPMGAFYCPYTNGSQCALVTKGWQPQEICQALECGQLKMLERASNSHHEAA